MSSSSASVMAASSLTVDSSSREDSDSRRKVGVSREQPRLESSSSTSETRDSMESLESSPSTTSLSSKVLRSGVLFCEGEVSSSELMESHNRGRFSWGVSMEGEA